MDNYFRLADKFLDNLDESLKELKDTNSDFYNPNRLEDDQRVPEDN